MIVAQRPIKRRTGAKLSSYFFCAQQLRNIKTIFQVAVNDFNTIPAKMMKLATMACLSLALMSLVVIPQTEAGCITSGGKIYQCVRKFIVYYLVSLVHNRSLKVFQILCENAPNIRRFTVDSKFIKKILLSNRTFL